MTPRAGQVWELKLHYGRLCYLVERLRAHHDEWEDWFVLDVERGTMGVYAIHPSKHNVYKQRRVA